MTGQRKYDAIVIGAGHNGLISAALLAQQSKKVLLLESRSSIGGASSTGEIIQGYNCPTVAHVYRGLHPSIVNSLKLKKHGLKLCAGELPTVSLSTNAQKHIVISEGFANAQYSDGSDYKSSKVVAQKLAQFKRFGMIFRQLLEQSPPNVHGSIADMISAARIGLSMRRLGKDDMQELMRIALSNIYDVLLDEMQDDPLAAAIALESLLGSHAGPRSPGNVMLLLQRFAAQVESKQACHAIPVGGMGALCDSIAESAKSLGVEIMVNAGVKRVLLDNDRACGVELYDGRIFQATSIFSSPAPRTTLLQMVGVGDLDAETVRDVRQIRCNGSNAKLNLALDSRPQFSGLTDKQHDARLLISPSLEHLEQGFNSQKYGEIPKSLIMEITLPSIRDQSLTNGAGHILSATLQYIPYHLKSGWNKDSEIQLENKIMDTLELYAPGIKQQVIGSQLLTPLALEERFGLPGGHWHHGELSVDQMLMMRPFTGSSRYSSPVPGLYFCGAGSHPGGDVSGHPGRNAVTRERKDRKRTP